MISFDCSKCGGICCANPPLLKTFEEGMKAKKLGVEIVASGDSKGGYFIAIAKRKDVCPFLDVESGNCKIYEERFESCRVFECKLIGIKHTEAIKELISNPEEALNSGKVLSQKPKPLTRSQVRKIGAKVINSKNKLLQKLSATNVSTFSMLMEKMITKL